MCANEVVEIADVLDAIKPVAEGTKPTEAERAAAAMQNALDWVTNHAAASDVYFIGYNPHGEGEVYFKEGIETLRRYLPGRHAEVVESIEVINYEVVLDGIRFKANTSRRRQAIDPARFTVVL